MRPLVVSRHGKVWGGFRPRSERTSCGNRPCLPATQLTHAQQLPGGAESNLRWRQQIERGWQQARAGDAADGPPTVREIANRLKTRAKKRA
jgi:hypothetical protein